MNEKEPFVTMVTAEAISHMGAELQKSYDGVSEQVTDFICSFNVRDNPLLVACLESIIEAIKNNFSPADKMLYKLVTMPDRAVVVSYRRRGGNGDGKG